MHRHTHMYNSPQEAAQSFIFSFHSRKRIREKSGFSLNHPVLPKLAAFTPQLSNLAHSNHINLIHLSYISDKKHCQFSWLQEYLDWFCVLDQRWDLVFQVIHRFWPCFVKADTQSNNKALPGQQHMLVTCSCTFLFLDSGTHCNNLSFNPLPYISPWPKACMLASGLCFSNSYFSFFAIKYTFGSMQLHHL